MSTRCMIHFHQGMRPEPEAIIYRHSDGYPDGANGVLADLERFFKDVEAQTADTRFGDPEYLAAKFVVWQAAENAAVSAAYGGSGRPLDFLSVGVALADHGDIEFRYHVRCGSGLRDNAMDMNPERPYVTWEATR